MASPSTAITRLDLSMTFNEFSNRLNRSKFIGHRVFPPMVVGKNSETYRVMPAEALITKIEDDTRAPKGGYKRDDWEWETDSYTTAEHGVEEITDDRQIKLYGEVGAEAINRDRALNRVAMAYEAACAAAAFDTSYFTGAYTAAVGTPWTTAATATPLVNLDAARAAFILNCGYSPNALAMEETALIALLRTAEIKDVVKYTGNLDADTAKNVIPQLRDLLRLDEIIVADAPVKNTAGRGQTPTFARLWGTTSALLFRKYDGPDLEHPEPYLGRTIMWSEEMGPLPGSDGEAMGVLVEEYREEARRGGVIRGRTDYVIKRQYKPAGYLLTGVTA